MCMLPSFQLDSTIGQLVDCYLCFLLVVDEICSFGVHKLTSRVMLPLVACIFIADIFRFNLSAISGYDFCYTTFSGIVCLL